MIGEPAFVAAHVQRQAEGIVNQINDTIARLQSFPHHAWSALYYRRRDSYAPPIDCLLQNLPPSVTSPHTRLIDNALVRMAEA